MYHANYANHPTPGALIGERTAAKSLLRIDSGGGAVDVDNSYDCCYLRRDWINKWTFSATTIIQASPGDKLSLQLKWIQGNLPDACEFEVRSNQTWLTIEKVQ